MGTARTIEKAARHDHDDQQDDVHDSCCAFFVKGSDKRQFPRHNLSAWTMFLCAVGFRLRRATKALSAKIGAKWRGLAKLLPSRSLDRERVLSRTHAGRVTQQPGLDKKRSRQP
jgi:hypothetical protein